MITTKAMATCLIWFMPFLLQMVSANVEKTVFVAPQASTSWLPEEHRDMLGRLDALSPSTLSVRKYLKATFPSDEAPYGSESWVYLGALNPGQRYEVRICWAAIQPTDFRLRTFTPSEVMRSSPILSSLTAYTAGVNQPDVRSPSSSSDLSSSSLFLSIGAAADYFSLNETLMNDVPPVLADIILDPYILNVLPRSLVPTVPYIVLVAVLGWFVANYIKCLVNKVVMKREVSEKKSK